MSREEVKTKQAKDKFCKSLDVGRARGKSEHFADEGGVIYCRRKNGEHQLVLPSSLATKVIALNHNPVTVSHTDSSHTFVILCLRFYWPRMQRNLDEYVKNFQECERVKTRHEFKAPLGDISEPTAPFDVTGMDIIGPFAVTASKNRYLLTFMDHLTHYSEAVPIQVLTAQQCARA